MAPALDGHAAGPAAGQPTPGTGALVSTTGGSDPSRAPRHAGLPTLPGHAWERIPSLFPRASGIGPTQPEVPPALASEHGGVHQQAEVAPIVGETHTTPSTGRGPSLAAWLAGAGLAGSGGLGVDGSVSIGVVRQLAAAAVAAAVVARAVIAASYRAGRRHRAPLTDSGTQTAPCLSPRLPPTPAGGSPTGGRSALQTGGHAHMGAGTRTVAGIITSTSPLLAAEPPSPHRVTSTHGRKRANCMGDCSGAGESGEVGGALLPALSLPRWAREFWMYGVLSGAKLAPPGWHGPARTIKGTMV